MIYNALAYSAHRLGPVTPHHIGFINKLTVLKYGFVNNNYILSQ